MNDDRISDLVPEGYTPLDIAFSIKCLDDDGNVTLVNGFSETLNAWERIGMLQSALDDARDAMRVWEHDVEDD